MNPRKNLEYKLFTTGWNAYQAVLEHDYLWHSMAATALNQLLADRFGTTIPFSFLDLACGDSATTSAVLQNFSLVNYVGVDSSPTALIEAARNKNGLGLNPKLIEADLLEFLANNQEVFDVIYVGLVAHHFGADNLQHFFDLICKRLKPGGLLIAYETFLLPDETLEEHINRLCLIIRYLWSEMPPVFKRNIIEHATTCDLPVSMAVWNEKTTNSGLTDTHIVMKSPDRLCAMVISSLK
ncbi:MAG: class I SAM-dependent methyltransferase [Planctomycetota bacterium]|nr:class I SAM-dependent methyltransferase [Planctomycetota bacterium]